MHAYAKCCTLGERDFYSNCFVEKIFKGYFVALKEFDRLADFILSDIKLLILFLLFRWDQHRLGLNEISNFWIIDLHSYRS